MTVKFIVCGADGTPIKLTPHGELVTGKTEHSLPYNAIRTSAGVSNIVELRTNNTFIITYLVVASDKTNVETQVDVYETRTVDGDATIAEAVILSGSLARNDRVVMPALDLRTKPSRFINVETDTAAVISITVMGYYEPE